MQAPPLVKLLVFLKTQNGFDRLAFTGIAAAAQSFGDTLVHICSTGRFEDSVKRYAADGAIISSDEPEWIAEVVASGLPCVNITNYLEAQAKVPVVGNDDASIGRLVAQHYLERGFRHFAYFANPASSYFGVRRDAFLKTLQAAGVGCAVGPVDVAAETGGQPEDWTKAAARWLGSLPRPLAVMCPWDVDALEAILACQIAKLRVPEDVSIIGVDNDEVVCLAIWPHLSSVATPAKKIGYEAATLVREMIVNRAGGPAEPRLLASTNIVVRKSSSETAVADPEVAAAINFIHANIRRPITVEDIVDKCSISRRALERRFIQYLGRTPREEIGRARVEMAKRLLAETDLMLAEVARRTGFRAQHLCRAIKSATGKTPYQFRRVSRPVSEP